MCAAHFLCNVSERSHPLGEVSTHSHRLSTGGLRGRWVWAKNLYFGKVPVPKFLKPVFFGNQFPEKSSLFSQYHFIPFFEVSSSLFMNLSMAFMN